MKKILILSLITVTIVSITIYLQSCKHENTEANYSIDKDSMFVSFESSNKVAENINKHEIVLKTVNDKSLLKSAKFNGIRTIKKSFTISDKQNVPYFYVFNYDSSGYIIVPADKRLRPIAAYNDQGYFKLDSLPLGIIIWLSDNANIIKELRKTHIQPKSFVSREWATMTSCPPDPYPIESSRLKIAPCKDTPPDPSTPPVVITVNPLLSTAWGQFCTYNDNCPYASGGYCQRAATGCVATSTAQVMAYWKYPSTYNWSQMPANQGSPEVARLMYDIGIAVHMSWGAYKSSAHFGNIGGSLVGVFGYSSAKYASYDAGSYQTVVNNLNNREPVILGGCNDHTTFLGIETSFDNCHAWVCDGYQQTYESGGNGYLYFHMNWGWHEYGATNNVNGWYAYNNWNSPIGYTFQYGCEMVYNIHP